MCAQHDGGTGGGSSPRSSMPSCKHQPQRAPPKERTTMCRQMMWAGLKGEEGRR